MNIKNKGILIIGGGILQSYAIIVAKERNLKVYIVDGSIDCYSKNLADHFFLIDTKDHEKVAELAVKLKRENKISAVFTQGTDVAYSVAYAAKKSGLPGINPDVAMSTENKILMRKLLYESKIDDTRYLVVRREEDLFKCQDAVGFPCFVKPADNSGSRGVSRVTSFKNLKAAYLLALKNNIIQKEVLIEEEIAGEEYSIDTIVIDNTLYNAGISDRVFKSKGKYAIQGGSITPSLLPEGKQQDMIKIMNDIAKVFKIDNSALKGDLIIDKNDNVKVIEVAARTSGGFDSQVRKPASFGIDIIATVMDISLGLKPDINYLIPKWVKWTKTISIFPKPGKVKSIEGINWIKGNTDIIDYKILTKAGDLLANYVDCASRNNYITFKANTHNELESVEKAIRNNFKILT